VLEADRVAGLQKQVSGVPTLFVGRRDGEEVQFDGVPDRKRLLGKIEEALISSPPLRKGE
jgi:hypothetical protein